MRVIRGRAINHIKASSSRAVRAQSPLVSLSGDCELRGGSGSLKSFKHMYDTHDEWDRTHDKAITGPAYGIWVQRLESRSLSHCQRDARRALSEGSPTSSFASRRRLVAEGRKRTCIGLDGRVPLRTPFVMNSDVYDELLPAFEYLSKMNNQLVWLELTVKTCQL